MTHVQVSVQNDPKWTWSFLQHQTLSILQTTVTFEYFIL